MFKLKNKTKIKIIIIIIILGLAIFLGLKNTKQVHAVDTNQTSFIANALNNLVDGSKGGINDIFDGKISVENLYKQALDATKSEDRNITKSTLEEIQIQLSHNGINREDLLNVLYDINPKVRSQIQETSCKDVKGKRPSVCDLSKKQITNSYIKLAISLCGKNSTEWKDISKDDKVCVTELVNDNYQILSMTNENIQQFSEETDGEDLFMNGSIEDSSYDLVNDINRIGNLLFDSFKAPVETLFYKFPTVKSGNGSTNSTSSNQPTTAAELLEAIKNNSMGSNSGQSYKTGAIATNNSILEKVTNIKPGTSGNIITNNTQDADIKDSEINSLINDTNNQPSQQIGVAQGNVCLPSIQSETESDQTEVFDSQITQEEKDAYISGLNDFIQNTRIQKENKNVLNVTQPISGDTAGFENAVENAINEIFDEGQAESCVEKCNGLKYDDKIICEIECLCFTVTYPKYTDPKLMNWNDSLKLRFCTIPVKAKSIQRGKNITSFDEMLTRIQSLFYNILNGGEMVTYQKTKEYIDNPIANLKRSEMFSFNIVVKFKALFANKSKKTLETKQVNKNKKLVANVGGKNENPVLDINKYVIIKDIKMEKVLKSSTATTVDELNKDVNKMEEELKQLTVEQNIQANTIKNQKSALINGMWGDFLSKNTIFWNDMTKLIIEMNSKANILKNKPYNAAN